MTPTLLLTGYVDAPEFAYDEPYQQLNPTLANAPIEGLRLPLIHPHASTGRNNPVTPMEPTRT